MAIIFGNIMVNPMGPPQKKLLRIIDSIPPPCFFPPVAGRINDEQM